MREVIIIDLETKQGQEVRKMLEKAHVNYKVYQEPKREQNWEIQEKKALQEWQNLSDEELITEWENLSDNEHVSTDNWN